MNNSTSCSGKWGHSLEGLAFFSRVNRLRQMGRYLSPSLSRLPYFSPGNLNPRDLSLLESIEAIARIDLFQEYDYRDAMGQDLFVLDSVRIGDIFVTIREFDEGLVWVKSDYDYQNYQSRPVCGFNPADLLLVTPRAEGPEMDAAIAELKRLRAIARWAPNRGWINVQIDKPPSNGSRAFWSRVDGPPKTYIGPVGSFAHRRAIAAAKAREKLPALYKKIKRMNDEVYLSSSPQ